MMAATSRVRAQSRNQAPLKRGGGGGTLPLRSLVFAPFADRVSRFPASCHYSPPLVPVPPAAPGFIVIEGTLLCEPGVRRANH